MLTFCQIIAGKYFSCSLDSLFPQIMVSFDVPKHFSFMRSYILIFVVLGSSFESPFLYPWVQACSQILLYCVQGMRFYTAIFNWDVWSWILCKVGSRGMVYSTCSYLVWTAPFVQDVLLSPMCIFGLLSEIRLAYGCQLICGAQVC